MSAFFDKVLSARTIGSGIVGIGLPRRSRDVPRSMAWPLRHSRPMTKNKRHLGHQRPSTEGSWSVVVEPRLSAFGEDGAEAGAVTLGL